MRKNVAGGGFFFQHIEDFRSPRGIGAVIKGQGYFIWVGAVMPESIGLGQGIKYFIRDQSGRRVHGDGPLSVVWPGLDAENLATPLRIDILTRRNFFQLVWGRS